ncbi:unnamed protein product [Clonostachys solani]|uniref:Ribose-5-phosphate isomerase n=1 Tax=Clonostachys solani TaxID=160281 RepID=A0A9N9ZK45_9HYPO|nr:unnamed protein product [Clonostachys solani]
MLMRGHHIQLRRLSRCSASQHALLGVAIGQYYPTSAFKLNHNGNGRNSSPLKTLMQTNHLPITPFHNFHSKRMGSTRTNSATVESAKQAAAKRAVDGHLSSEHRWVGIGSGSTIVYLVDTISKWEKGLTDRMKFVPTGEQSRLLIEAAGLRLGSLSQLPRDELLDVCFDGADEIDRDLNLIKGGGACLLQEKVVATASKKFICVAVESGADPCVLPRKDYRKSSDWLCSNWRQGVPIEVLPSAASRVLAELRRLGSINPSIRQGGTQKAGPVVTDNSMWIIDAPFPALAAETGTSNSNADPNNCLRWTSGALARRLIRIPGIIETGLFTGHDNYGGRGGAERPVAVYLGLADGGVEVFEA